jgi:hypothetical protein
VVGTGILQAASARHVDGLAEKSSTDGSFAPKRVGAERGSLYGPHSGRAALAMQSGASACIWTSSNPTGSTRVCLRLFGRDRCWWPGLRLIADVASGCT